MSPVPPRIARAADLALEATVAPSFSRVGCAVRSRLEGWAAPTSSAGVRRRILVTGANSGLGYATVGAALTAGNEVVGTVRSSARAEDTHQRITAELGAEAASRLRTELVDLADLGAVRRLVARLTEDHEPLDIVVHNAGAMFAERELTVDGLERTYQIHVVAPFLLTTLLLPDLRRSSVGRVVTVTSGGMYTERLDVARLESPDDYRGASAYARAKRAQVALTDAWAQRVPGIDVQAVHPGWALTPGIVSSLPTFRRVAGPLLRTPGQGADSIVWVALHPDPLRSGQLWHDRRSRSAHRVPWTRSSDAEVARLWDRVTRDAGVDPAAP